MRRKSFLYIVVLVAAFLFVPFFAGNSRGGKKEELKDMAETYVGVYECTQLKYGSRDLFEAVDSARLELKRGGEYILVVKMKNGDEKSDDGAYEVNGEKITFYSGAKYAKRRGFNGEFSLENGKIVGTRVLHGKTLYVVFSRG